ncbi:PAS domain S-box-containing protein [Abditibacterium utsteinense]|uniref:histidine kinase n=1 Tax=Abditibacterium utsteinense TaxID=1960156 RepID=A0A2S8SWB9_9BACT|nr:PAS domain S-box protein [Abditibacterium utsteinense]PQV65088.1 PAS domain S-box-containing protein [Abditibacterium utsteinense]
MKGAKTRRFPLIFVACSLALGTLCVLMSLTYLNFRRLQAANRWNVHSYQVLDEIAVANAVLKEEESQLRGFAFTGDRQFLRSALGKADSGSKALGALRSLTADRQEQQKRLKKITVEYGRWHLALNDLQKEKSAVMAPRTKSQTRARLGDLLALQKQLATVEAFERAQLASRSTMQQSSRTSTAKSLLLASVVTVSLSSVLMLLLALQTRSLGHFNQQLRGNEEQLRTLLDNAPVVLYRVDLAENYVLFKGKALEKLGLSAKNMEGRPVVEAMGENFNIEPIRDALRGKSSVSVNDFRGVTFETHRHPLRDENGAITGMIGVSIDVNERQSAEIALRESEARFQAFMDNSPMLAFIKDRKGRMIYNNGPMLRRFGKTEDEMWGKDDFDLWPPEVARVLVEHDQRVLDGEKMIAVEESVPTPEGDSPTWLSFKFPLRDALGHRLIGALAIDITERKVAEDKLRATSILQRAILDGAPYSIIAASPDGIIQSFNRAAERLLGYRSTEVCGVRSIESFHDADELAAHAAQLSAELQRPIAPGLETLFVKPRAGMIEERDWTYLRHDGSRLPVRLSIAVMHDSDGQVTGYVGIGYDLTESQRAERLKNEFVSVVSHELRTPLTSIRGALGLLAGGMAGELPPGAQQMIEIAQKNSDRLVLLINDILDIEKIESGKMRFDLHSFALRQWLESAIEQNSAYAQALGVTLELEDAQQIDAIEVFGDENRLQQVLSNLLSNACKFTPSGGVVTLRAHVESASEASNFGAEQAGAEQAGAEQLRSGAVQISVIDEGPGVPAEFVPRLFEKFAQADSSSTRKQGGTGLGLAIARAIVEKHGGALNYRAPQKINQGATFQFDLPIYRSEAPDAETETHSAARVLICEDDPETAALLATLVKQSGFEVEIALTLQEARAHLDRSAAPNEEFAGITLDLLLPDGDGADLIEELRAAGRNLPVVVVSATAEAGHLSGEALRVLDWLVKPVDGARLQAALQQFHGPEVPRLLHVEDDADVRRIVAAILGESALIVQASTLQEARHRLQTERFDLAILDMSLPDGSGLELVAQLNVSEPPTPIILFSATETNEAQSQGVTASLVKSRTDNEVLRSTIHRFLGDSSK